MLSIVPIVMTAVLAADAAPALKQLPLPSSPKQAEARDTTTDPTAIATRAAYQGVVVAARTAPAPFQRFTIPNPLEALASIPTRTPVADAEAPVNANAGRPVPVLK